MAGTLVKEGVLLKRGEFIQNLRPRWFVLKSDGSFRGYKQRPEPDELPSNVFDVQRCELASIDQKGPPKKGEGYGFVIRFMQLTRVFERMFFTETLEERDAWLAAINVVRKKVASVDEITDRARAVSFIDPKKPQACDISLSDFDLLKLLGKGTFGKVLLVKLKGTKELFAMKVLRKDHILEKGELAHTLTENSVLAKCAHPFITSLKYSFQ
jgi:RAC serine/threonine-protein kinase